MASEALLFNSSSYLNYPLNKAGAHSSFNNGALITRVLYDNHKHSFPARIIIKVVMPEHRDERQAVSEFFPRAFRREATWPMFSRWSRNANDTPAFFFRSMYSLALRDPLTRAVRACSKQDSRREPHKIEHSPIRHACESIRRLDERIVRNICIQRPKRGVFFSPLKLFLSHFIQGHE